VSDAIPGVWVCDKCGFVLETRTMNAFTGNVSVRRVIATEPCPNDGTPLRSFTRDDMDEAIRIAREGEP
jgi:rubrerythrin